MSVTLIKKAIHLISPKCEVCLKVTCDCWVHCPCGWSYLKGAACSNPRCGSRA